MMFGEIADGIMALNHAGEIVRDIWYQIPVHFQNVTPDAFVIMPNHIHGILTVGAGLSRPDLRSSAPNFPSSAPVSRLSHIDSLHANDDDQQEEHDGGMCNNCGGGGNGWNGRGNGGGGRENRAPTVGQMVAYFKYISTKQFNESRNAGIQKLWQRNYYEHIIRDDSDLNRIREYIWNNPLNWLTDTLYG
jgi:REP element-mobilizing transposase RayT